MIILNKNNTVQSLNTLTVNYSTLNSITGDRSSKNKINIKSCLTSSTIGFPQVLQNDKTKLNLKPKLSYNLLWDVNKISYGSLKERNQEIKNKNLSDRRKDAFLETFYLKKFLSKNKSLIKVSSPNNKNELLSHDTNLNKTLINKNIVSALPVFLRNNYYQSSNKGFEFKSENKSVPIINKYMKYISKSIGHLNIERNFEQEKNDEFFIYLKSYYDQKKYNCHSFTKKYFVEIKSPVSSRAFTQKYNLSTKSIKKEVGLSSKIVNEIKPDFSKLKGSAKKKAVNKFRIKMKMKKKKEKAIQIENLKKLEEKKSLVSNKIVVKVDKKKEKENKILKKIEKQKNLIKSKTLIKNIIDKSGSKYHSDLMKRLENLSLFLYLPKWVYELKYLNLGVIEKIENYLIHHHSIYNKRLVGEKNLAEFKNKKSPHIINPFLLTRKNSIIKKRTHFIVNYSFFKSLVPTNTTTMEYIKRPEAPQENLIDYSEDKKIIWNTLLGKWKYYSYIDSVRYLWSTCNDISKFYDLTDNNKLYSKDDTKKFIKIKIKHTNSFKKSNYKYYPVTLKSNPRININYNSGLFYNNKFPNYIKETLGTGEVFNLKDLEYKVSMTNNKLNFNASNDNSFFNLPNGSSYPNVNKTTTQLNIKGNSHNLNWEGFRASGKWNNFDSLLLHQKSSVFSQTQIKNTNLDLKLSSHNYSKTNSIQFESQNNVVENLNTNNINKQIPVKFLQRAVKRKLKFDVRRYKLWFKKMRFSTSVLSTKRSITQKNNPLSTRNSNIQKPSTIFTLFKSYKYNHNKSNYKYSEITNATQKISGNSINNKKNHAYVPYWTLLFHLKHKKGEYWNKMMLMFLKNKFILNNNMFRHKHNHLMAPNKSFNPSATYKIKSDTNNFEYGDKGSSVINMISDLNYHNIVDILKYKNWSAFKYVLNPPKVYKKRLAWINKFKPKIINSSSIKSSETQATPPLINSWKKKPVRWEEVKKNNTLDQREKRFLRRVRLKKKIQENFNIGNLTPYLKSGQVNSPLQKSSVSDGATVSKSKYLLNKFFSRWETRKNITDIYTFISSSFKAMGSVISYPVFITTPNKIRIQLFYFLLIPFIVKKKNNFKKIYSNHIKTGAGVLYQKKNLKSYLDFNFRNINKIRTDSELLRLDESVNIVNNKYQTCARILNKGFESNNYSNSHPSEENQILSNLEGHKIILSNIYNSPNRPVSRQTFFTDQFSKFKTKSVKSGIKNSRQFSSSLHVENSFNNRNINQEPINMSLDVRKQQIRNQGIVKYKYKKIKTIMFKYPLLSSFIIKRKKKESRKLDYILPFMNETKIISNGLNDKYSTKGSLAHKNNKMKEIFLNSPGMNKILIQKALENVNKQFLRASGYNKILNNKSVKNSVTQLVESNENKTNDLQKVKQAKDMYFLKGSIMNKILIQKALENVNKQFLRASGYDKILKEKSLKDGTQTVTQITPKSDISLDAQNLIANKTEGVRLTLKNHLVRLYGGNIETNKVLKLKRKKIKSLLENRLPVYKNKTHFIVRSKLLLKKKKLKVISKLFKKTQVEQKIYRSKRKVIKTSQKWIYRFKLKSKIKILKLNYSSNNFLKIHQKKLNRISQIISFFFQKPIELELIRMHYPYNNTRILVSLIAQMIYKKRVQYLVRKIVKTSSYDSIRRKKYSTKILNHMFVNAFKKMKLINKNLINWTKDFKLKKYKFNTINSKKINTELDGSTQDNLLQRYRYLKNNRKVSQSKRNKELQVKAENKTLELWKFKSINQRYISWKKNFYNRLNIINNSIKNKKLINRSLILGNSSSVLRRMNKADGIKLKKEFIKNKMKIESLKNSKLSEQTNLITSERNRIEKEIFNLEFINKKIINFSFNRKKKIGFATQKTYNIKKSVDLGNKYIQILGTKRSFKLLNKIVNFSNKRYNLNSKKIKRNQAFTSTARTEMERLMYIQYGKGNNNKFKYLYHNLSTLKLAEYIKEVKYKLEKNNVKNYLHPLTSDTQSYSNKVEKISYLPEGSGKRPVGKNRVVANVIEITEDKTEIENLNKKVLYWDKGRGDSLPSYVAGMTFRAAGRFKTQRVIPRYTTYKRYLGCFSPGKVNYTEFARYTNKAKRGSFSFTVYSCYNWY